ncbi:GspH/FimT family pseudopilin [Comamonas terrae]|uniref:Type II secretion system protein H n=1 Tax=Comamonas terrae TaxID=673548 RepID=A0ABW5UJF7_9BURK|nr:GspH/FimT family pseudopilin [Comamonas terrae]
MYSATYFPSHHHLVRIGSHGVTSIELLITLAILGVLAALAAPGFKPLIDRWRIRQVTEGLKAALYFARSEAIKRGGNITIQKLPNKTGNCNTAIDTSDWDCGWLVCLDSNNDGTCAAKEVVLQRYDAPANVQITRTSGSASIKFNRWGLVDGKWPGFSLVPMNQSTMNPAALGLCMSSGGRIRVIPPEAIPCSP